MKAHDDDEVECVGDSPSSDGLLIDRDVSGMQQPQGQEEEAIDESSHDSVRIKQQQQLPRWKTITIYVMAASTAVCLTIACSGTRLWKTTSSSVVSNHLNLEALLEVMAVYLLTLVALCLVQGSDPGYMDGRVMMRFRDEEDGSLSGLLTTETVGNGMNSVVRVEMTQRLKPSSSSGSDYFIPITTTAPESPLHLSSQNDVNSLDPLQDCSNNNNSKSSLLWKTNVFQGARRKFCTRCNIAPPLRSHHCRICNKCVATFDHHCLFIGTCIGERNHCRFWWFLSSQMVGLFVCSAIIASSSVGLTTSMVSSNSTVVGYYDWWIVLMSKIYLYTITTAAFVMWVTHSVLALGNMTTFECGKGPKHLDYLKGTREMDLPFSKGFMDNVQVFCCVRDAFWSKLTGQRRWTPILWKLPSKIVRDSEDWWEHPWQNKYWSCC